MVIGAYSDADFANFGVHDMLPVGALENVDFGHGFSDEASDPPIRSTQCEGVKEIFPVCLNETDPQVNPQPSGNFTQPTCR
jgi:hypothetical protein